MVIIYENSSRMFEGIFKCTQNMLTVSLICTKRHNMHIHTVSGENSTDLFFYFKY